MKTTLLVKKKEETRRVSENMEHFPIEYELEALFLSIFFFFSCHRLKVTSIGETSFP